MRADVQHFRRLSPPVTCCRAGPMSYHSVSRCRSLFFLPPPATNAAKTKLHCGLSDVFAGRSPQLEVNLRDIITETYTHSHTHCMRLSSRSGLFIYFLFFLPRPRVPSFATSRNKHGVGTFICVPFIVGGSRWKGARYTAAGAARRSQSWRCAE